MKLPLLIGSGAERVLGARLRPTKRGKLLLKGAAWASGLVVLFALVGFFVVPPVAKYYLVKSLSEQLHRRVAIRDIDVNPFALTLTVRDLSIQEPGGSGVFVSFEELFVNVKTASAWRRAPIVEEIRLQRPYAHVVRLEDGSYNFSDLLKQFAQAPKPPTSQKQTEEAHFALNNIQIIGGRVDFDDRPKAAKHAVTDINVAIPFLSNLHYLADRYVQPSFSAKINDTPFAINGRTKPFEQSLETQVDLNLYALDIPRYMEYVPVKLGFKIASGLLDTRLTATFARYQNKEPTLVIAGKVALQKFSLTQLDGRPLAGLARLDVPVESAKVFARQVKLGSIAVDSPEVYVRRERDGTLNWMSVVPKDSAASKDDETSNDAETPEDARSNAQPALNLDVTEVKVDHGQVHFADDTAAKPFKTDLEDLRIVVQKLVLPQTAPASLELDFKTRFGESVKHTGTLLASPLDVDGSVELTGVKPRNYAPYYSNLVLFDIEDGTLNLSTRFHLAQANKKVSATVAGLDAVLTKLRLRKRGMQDDFLTLAALAVKGVNLDLGKRTVQVAEVSSKEARLHVTREKDGTIDLTRPTPAQNSDQPPAREKAEAPPVAESPNAKRPADSWQWLVRKVAIDRYAFVFDDQAPAQPVTHLIDPIKLTAQGLSNRQDSTGDVALDAGVNKSGRLQLSGPVGLSPLSANLKVEIQGVGLVPLQPYFAEKLNILVTSGEVLVRGTLGVKSQDAGPIGLTFKGDAGVNNFASVDKAESADFLKWKSLFFGGVDTATQPFALSIQEIALSDFFSRLIIYPTGQLNVQTIMVKEGTAAAPEAEAATEQKTAVVEPPKNAPAGNDKPVAPGTSGTQPQVAGAPLPVITIGKVTLQGGNVDFTDLFIKPNYSAHLTEIGGSVTGLSSQLDTTADVDLRGRFAKTAPVEIKGKINPLVKNLYADIQANVRDIELGPFTPYSAKYVGYGIEKGKMSFDVAYKIENRKLAARNRLTLDQLTFGDKIESPTATKLPVLLAVSLLQDRNGVIDVSLPISGSLDDPKFSVGGIVLQIIFNLIEKAVTAPFALIGSMFGGGGEELAFIDFDPGRAALTPASEDKLAKLQKALTERPKLKLDVTGHADPGKDREGLLHYKFDQQIKAQKLKDLVKKGSSVSSLDEVKIDPQEYEIYLKRAYKEAKFPKPRNLIGLPKDLPREEMEKLMLTNIQVTNDDLVQLANQRAQAAKDFITRGEQVPVDRVFLLAPKLETPKADDKLAAARVDFSLK